MSKPFGDGWPRTTSGSTASSPPGTSTPASAAPRARPAAIWREHLRVGVLDGQVVDQRDRLGADADDVVDVHRHAVDPDRVEAARLLGHDHLRAGGVGPDGDAEVVGHLQHRRVVAGGATDARRRAGLDRRRARARSRPRPRRPGACRPRRRRTRRSSARILAGAAAPARRAPRPRPQRRAARRPGAAPAASPAALANGRDRARRRPPPRRRATAPSVTGTPTSRDSGFASVGAKPAQPRHGQRRAVARHARPQRRAPARARATAPSADAGVPARPRPARRPRPRPAAPPPNSSPGTTGRRDRASAPPRTRAPAGMPPASRCMPTRRQDRRRRIVARLVAAAPHQRRQRPGVQRHLVALQARAAAAPPPRVPTRTPAAARPAPGSGRGGLSGVAAAPRRTNR